LRVRAVLVSRSSLLLAAAPPSSPPPLLPLPTTLSQALCSCAGGRVPRARADGVARAGNFAAAATTTTTKHRTRATSFTAI
jgi:hypothetical protein